MPRAESVVFGLIALKEPGKPAAGAYGVELVGAAGEYLVRVRLVARVENDAVPGRVENIVQRKYKIGGAQARGEVAPRSAYALYDELANLGRELRQG